MSARPSIGWIKRIVKYVALALGFLTVAFILLVWVVFKQKNEWLLRELQTYVNEAQTGRLEVSEMELNVLGSFPDLQVSFHEIRYYNNRNDSTLESLILQADQVSVSVKLIPLWREQLEISEVMLSQGELRLATDSIGKLNLATALKPPVTPVKKVVPPSTRPDKPKPKEQQKKVPSASTPSHVQIDLQQVQFEDLKLSWHPYQDDSSEVYFKQVSMDLNQSQEMMAVYLESEHELRGLAVAGDSFYGDAGSVEAELKYNRKTHTIAIAKATLDQSGIGLSVQGQYDFQKQNLDLEIDGSVKELEFLEVVLRPEIVKRNPDLLKQGEIFVKGRVFGSPDHPQSDLSFGVKDLSWKVPGKTITFENIGFSGQFESGASPDYSQARLMLRNIRGQLPQGSIGGYFTMINFVTPYIEYDLDLRTRLDGFDEVFSLGAISELVGAISVQAGYKGQLRSLTRMKADSSRSNRVELNTVSFLVNRSGLRVADLNALLLTDNDQTQVQPLTFRYGENQVQAQLAFDRNLFLAILDPESGVRVKGHVVSPRWHTRDFIPDTLKHASIQDQIRDLKFDVEAALVQDSSYQRNRHWRLDVAVSNLSARFDELPDIEQLAFKSSWRKAPQGLQLNLQEFQVSFPQGQVSASGELKIVQPNLWNIQADLRMKQFPWTYIRELSAELQENQEPKFKRIPTSEMDFITTDVRVSTAIIPYPFDIRQASISAGHIVYQAPQAKPIQADDVHLELNPLVFKHPENSGSITGVELATGSASIGQLQFPGLTIRKIKTDLHGSQDTLHFEFVCTTLDSKQEQGELKLNLSGRQPVYGLQYRVDEAKLESVIKEVTTRKLMSGNVNYELNLKATGVEWTSIKRSMMGTIEVSGQSLQLYGVDVDNVLKKYQKSQNFNLTDVGAVLIAGPIGLAVTKGTDFVSLASVSLDADQQTQISTLYARWNLDQLQLRTEDVAFATPLNRIAIQGQIDFLNESIPGMTIAVVDSKGCSLMDQKFTGKFGALQSGKLNITKTLLGSVINFVNAVAGVDCIPVYTGKVNHPK